MGAVLVLLAAMALAPDDLHAAFEAVKAAQAEVAAADGAKDAARLQAAQAALRPLQARFKDLFAGADWNALDPVKDRELLSGGLMTAGRDALARGDGGTAVRAFEAILSKFGREPFAKAVGMRLLPTALLAAGEPAKAAARWEAGSADPDPGTAAPASLLLGDLRCAMGDLPAAKAAWRKAAAAQAAAPDGTVPELYAAERLTLVGTQSPEIDSKTWLGAEAVPLSRHLGKIVVLDFFSTGNAPSRESMAGLDALYAAERVRGLLVLGVTHPYPDGFLPRRGTKDPVGDGEPVKRIPEERYPAHLKEFRENLGTAYPFVLAGQPDYDAYGVKAIPCRVVLDREGIIAFLRVGGGDETLFRTAVRRLLERK